MMMEFWAEYWKQIVIIAMYGVVFLFGYYKGYEHEKVKYDALVSQMKFEQTIAEAHYKEVVQDQQNVTTKVVKGYADAVNNLKQYYANHPNWVQSNDSASSQVSCDATAAKGTDDTTQSNQSSASGNATLDCASDVLQLLTLQKWVSEQANAE